MAKNLQRQLTDALAKKVVEDTDKAMYGTSPTFTKETMEAINGVWVPESYERKMSMERNARDWQKQIMNDWQAVRKEKDPLKQVIDELSEIKIAMRKLNILLDSDLPDEEVFEKFRMLREAYRKYKMVEKLVLGQDDGRKE